MSQQAKISIVAVDRENYHHFKAMVNRRLGREEKPDQPLDGDLGFLNQDNIWVYAAQADGAFVGWVSAVLIPKPDDRKGLLFIDEMWTDENYRNLGIGRLLLDRAIDLARELNLWKVRLYVDSDNPAARRLYANVGFREEHKKAIFCQREP